jgi:hypothetical protein
MNCANEAMIEWGMFVLCGCYMGVNAPFGDRLLALGRYFNTRELRYEFLKRAGVQRA